MSTVPCAAIASRRAAMFGVLPNTDISDHPPLPTPPPPPEPPPIPSIHRRPAPSGSGSHVSNPIRRRSQPTASAPRETTSEESYAARRNGDSAHLYGPNTTGTVDSKLQGSL